MKRIWIKLAAALTVLFIMSSVAPAGAEAVTVPFLSTDLDCVTAGSAPAGTETLSAPEARAMALIECESGMLLAGKNEELRLPMASTTKIMTALIVIENNALDEIVDIPDEAIGVEGSSAGLQCGERMTVEDLLYGLMLASGNDAAVALAVHVGGSVEAFAGMMNKKAEELGLSGTHFVTPNGLHSDRHYTTAYELCLIARAALREPEFRQIVSAKYHRTESGNFQRTFKNKNSLLWTYDGAFGIKTGYTKTAGRCLVFGAERDGMTLVGAVLDCGPMFETAADLLDRAFGEFSRVTVIEGGERVLETIIDNDPQNVLEVVTEYSIITVMRRNDEAELRAVPELISGLSAPINRGDTVGELCVYRGDELIGSTRLLAANEVIPREFGYWLRLLFRLFAA